MTFNTRLTCGVAALLAGTCSTVADEPAIAYRKYTLENGLTLLVHEDHKAPIVAVNVWYHVGSKNEQPRRTGFAHLFEHLMFNGSEHFDDDYFKALERVGVTGINGTTNEDRTNYFQEVPREALDTVLWMESDRMGHLLGAVTQARLDEQRGVVLNEKRQGDNQPYRLAWRLITQHTWPQGHPYSWEVIGSEADIEAATLTDVHDWFRAFYGAANAVIVVAGDVSAEQVHERVRHFFGDIPSGPPITRYSAYVAKRRGTQRMRAQDRVPHARLYKVWNIPQYGTTEGNLLSMVGEVLATGKSSRLYRRLVYDTQLATEVSAGAYLNEIAGQFMIVATAQPGVALAQIEQIIDEELKRLLEQGPTADELHRVQVRCEADFVRGCERVGGFGGKSDILARDFVLTGCADYYQTQLREVRAATASQLAEVARTWLRDGEFVLTIDPLPDYSTVTSTVDRTELPIPEIKPVERFPALQRAVLSNGLQVVLAERHETPLVLCTLSVNAGIASDVLSASGAATLWADLLDEGTSHYTALELGEALEQLGTHLSTQCTLDTTTVSLNTLTAHLEASLELFADVILHPTFPEADVQRLKQQRMAAIQSEKNNPGGLAMRVLPRLVYGPDHAYGGPFSGSGATEAVSGLTRETLVACYRTWFRPNNATLVVAGDVSLADLLPRLERLFGQWQVGAIPSKTIAQVSAPNHPCIYLVDRPAAAQTLLCAACLAPPKANPLELGVEALNTLLGGTFTSRVNMNLREEKHWSYGVRTQVVDARGPRVFLCMAPVQSDRVADAMRELQGEFVGVTGTRPPTEAELHKAIEVHTLQRAGRWETLRAVSGAMEEMVRFGLPEDYHATYAAQMRAMTLSEVSQAAREVVKPSELVWLVIGDRAKIEQSIQALGWGMPIILTPDGTPLNLGEVIN